MLNTLKIFAAGAVLAVAASNASASTCTVGHAWLTVDQATDSVCGTGSDDAYLSSNPDLFGQNGWTLAESLPVDTGDGALSFVNGPVLETSSGSFSVDNPGTETFAISLESYNYFAFFDVGSSLSDFDWSTGADLTSASLWYIPTAVPLPAGGALLLTALGAFAVARRRSRG